MLCKTNTFPCVGGNILATLTTSVNATTGAWNVQSGNLGTQATVYARASQTDVAGNIGNSSIAGPISKLTTGMESASHGRVGLRPARRSPA